MFLRLILFLFITSFLSSFSQRSEVVFKSKVNHNYALGYDYYVEDYIDTSKLIFMGVLKIISSNQDILMVNSHQLLKTKTKELNGNSYKLKSFSKQDTTLTLLFDVYFAPDKQIDLIKKNRVKETIFVFNNIKDTIYRNLFVNNRAYLFKRNKHLEIFATGDNEFKLKLDSTNFVNQSNALSKNQDALFFTIKLKDNLAPALIGGVLGGVIGAIVVSSLANKYINPENETISKINYNTGRILKEIYPLDKLITLD